jgi:hypothetical protein
MAQTGTTIIAGKKRIKNVGLTNAYAFEMRHNQLDYADFLATHS